MLVRVAAGLMLRQIDNLRGEEVRDRLHRVKPSMNYFSIICFILWMCPCWMLGLRRKLSNVWRIDSKVIANMRVISCWEYRKPTEKYTNLFSCLFLLHETFHKLIETRRYPSALWMPFSTLSGKYCCDKTIFANEILQSVQAMVFVFFCLKELFTSIYCSIPFLFEGQYLYAAGSNSGHIANVAKLFSGLQLPDRTGFLCMRFRYRMSGLSVGTLRVLDDNANELWSKSGDQGRHWHSAAVSVPAAGPFEVRKICFKFTTIYLPATLACV